MKTEKQNKKFKAMQQSNERNKKLNFFKKYDL